MIFLKLSKFSKLLLIELRKTGRRYLQVLEMNSCAHNGGCNLGFLIGYHSLAMDVFSGVSRISFRGGVQNFSGKVWVFAWREAPCSAWRSHAFARRVRGHAPPRKFLEMVQFGVF